MIDTEKEFETIQKIHDLLKNMDSAANERILKYVQSALKISIPVGDKSQVDGPSSDAPEVKRGGQANENEQPELTDFADLFSSVNPQRNADKALVAGFWLQERSGDNSFDAQNANRELINMGHRLSNITVSLNQLIQRSPALVVQVRKKGKSQQARKLYRVTHEGRKRVYDLKAEADN
ncbi:MAG: hypothetical protein OXG88_03680 [Gammaproteobacteria bacterium]|nr:hypothetical protein [Gammaproteobacteria bacterium]